jgi:tensin
VFNVSEKSYDISKLDHQVLDFGWPDHHAPTLERLCSVCKSMASWLGSDARNVCVVHCKGGKGRTGVAVAAYLNYSRLFHRADDAMFQFAAKRFSADADPELTGITQPSQRRYVAYFAQVLARELDIRPRPVRLDRLRVTAVPGMGGNGTLCRPVVRVYLVQRPPLGRLPWWPATHHWLVPPPPSAPRI